MLEKTIISKYKQIPFLVKEILEGFITGLHRSPFHGFSSEFLEYKQYFQGDNVKAIDWKMYAKTDRYYVKKYQENTNLKCHFIIDNSSSMHYPIIKNYYSIENPNKFSFSAISTACLMEIMRKQQDSMGISIYSDDFEFYISEKNNPKHHNLLISELEKRLTWKTSASNTNTHKILHHIAEKLSRKSLVIIFTDMIDTYNDNVMEAIKHLKYRSHKVILFQIYDSNTENNLSFENKPTLLIDMETQKKMKIKKIQDLQDFFKLKTDIFFNKIREECTKYNIDYVKADIQKGFYNVLEEYLIKRKNIKL